MAAVDMVDDVSGSTEWATEMESYSLHWKSSFLDWNGRDISVLLPAGTQYSRGTITNKIENGYRNMPDLVDGSAGIPIPSSEKVALSLSAQTRREDGGKVTTSKVTQMATLSLSLIKTPKEEYLDQLKKKSLQVLSETENSLVTISKPEGFSISDTLVKTIVVDNVVLQIQTSVFRLNKEPIQLSAMYQLFERIRLSKA